MGGACGSDILEQVVPCVFPAQLGFLYPERSSELEGAWVGDVL